MKRNHFVLILSHCEKIKRDGHYIKMYASHILLFPFPVISEYRLPHQVDSYRKEQLEEKVRCKITYCQKKYVAEKNLFYRWHKIRQGVSADITFLLVSISIAIVYRCICHTPINLPALVLNKKKLQRTLANTIIILL